MSELLAYINALNLAYEYLCSLGNAYSGKLCYLSCGLSYYLCVYGAVDDYGLSDLVKLFALKEVAASVCKLSLDRLIYAVQNYYRLLGCAYHSVVEGLRVNDGVYGKDYVCGVVDYCGSVSCADAECGLS